jgi:hypothetical protein
MLNFRQAFQALLFFSAATLFSSIAIAGPSICLAQAPSATPQLHPTDGALSGIVADPSGAVIPNATIHIELHNSSTTNRNATAKNTTSDATGHYAITLPSGTYDVIIVSPGFDPFLGTARISTPGTKAHLDAALNVATQSEVVNVPIDNASSTSADDNHSAMVFKSTELETFSDDDATFQQQLLAIAGGDPSQPPNVYVDGFSGGQIPPKDSIREVRINQNPFSAQYQDLGFGRVEIFTKPGSDKLHGRFQVFGNDNALNSLNPYTGAQPPYYSLVVQENLNGPIGKKTSFFFNGSYNDQQFNSVINTAATPDSSNAPFSGSVSSPTLTNDYSFRLDRQVTPTNTFTSRYEFNRVDLTNAGLLVAQTLATQAYNSTTINQTLQLSDTQTIGAKMISETRFQYIRTRLDQNPISTAPTIIVQGYFNGGGNSAQTLHDNQDHYEFQEYVSLQHGSHFFRIGGRYRSTRDANLSTSNYNGQFTYSPSNNNTISALTNFENRQPSQFSITAGQPSAVVVTGDLSLYADDEWKLTKNVTLNFGIRAESQSAIPDHFDPAPRIGAAWAIGQTAKRPAIVVLRSGFGLFYDRFASTNILTSIRQNGVSQQSYYASFTSASPPPSVCLTSPSITNCGLTATQPTIYRIDSNLRSEYQVVAGLTAEHTFGKYGSVTVNFLHQQGDHQWISRNINAPLPGTYNPAVANSGVYPFGSTQAIYQFSSNASSSVNIVFTNGQLNLSKFLNLWFFMGNRYKNSDTSGATSFPSDQYHVAADFGRIASQHYRLFTGANVKLPYRFTLSPFFSYMSSAPFNITTGTDLNGDTIYNDRPSFATSASPIASVYKTPYGTFNASPQSGETIIPVNYGNGPGLVYAALRVGKDFKFGTPSSTPAAAGAKPASPVPKSDPPYTLSFSAEADNIFNHVNPAPPIGVLSSPDFGKSVTVNGIFGDNTAANRIISLRASFNF